MRALCLAALLLARALAVADIASRPFAVGCGSNVVDRFFRVRAIPRPGEKGYFASPTSILEDSIVGGVTLNHLAWAAELGVPAALLARQGEDNAGRLIREAMEAVGVSTSFVDVSMEFTTAESYVLSQPSDGERSIIMASGSTSTIDKAAMDDMFGRLLAVESPKIVTTEVSQLPLSGVEALLIAANRKGAVTVLDVDVSPSVCVSEARLGSETDFVRCVKLARVVKPTRHAAFEMLQLLKTGACGGEDVREDMSAESLAAALQRASGADLVALTAGDGGCALATASHQVYAKACAIPKVVDTTGAGDAFLGGLIAGLHQRMVRDGVHGGVAIPGAGDEAGLREMADLANAAGAACCEGLGGLPRPGARARVLELRGGDEDGTAHMRSFEESLAMDAATLARLSSAAGREGSAAAREDFVRTVLECSGRVHVTGIGKSGVVARRLAASLASTGTPASFTHACEWAHGELGVANPGVDIVIALSHSGSTAEVIAAATHLHQRGLRVCAITSAKPEGEGTSPLEDLSDAALTYALPEGVFEPLGGAPACSIVAQEALANALVRELIARRGFTKGMFKTNHPGGALGNSL